LCSNPLAGKLLLSNVMNGKYDLYELGIKTINTAYKIIELMGNKN
jgi:hypothetical protein